VRAGERVERTERFVEQQHLRSMASARASPTRCLCARNLRRTLVLGVRHRTSVEIMHGPLIAFDARRAPEKTLSTASRTLS